MNIPKSRNHHRNTPVTYEGHPDLSHPINGPGCQRLGLEPLESVQQGPGEDWGSWALAHPQQSASHQLFYSCRNRRQQKNRPSGSQGQQEYHLSGAGKPQDQGLSLGRIGALKGPVFQHLDSRETLLSILTKTVLANSNCFFNKVSVMSIFCFLGLIRSCIF